MAVNRFLVRSFRITLAQNVSGPGLDTQVAATIACYGDDRASAELTIAFVRPGFELPANSSRSDCSAGTLFVPSVDFPWYYNLLHSNNRIRARISDRDPDSNQLETLVKRGETADEGPGATGRWTKMEED